MDRRTYDWLALNFVDGLGKVGYCNLIRKFSSPERVFNASLKDLGGVEGLRQKAIRGIKEFEQTARVNNELKLMHAHGVSLVTLLDDNYPSNLLNIYDPPPFLYVKGELKKEDKIAVAVVGSGIDLGKAAIGASIGGAIGAGSWWASGAAWYR